MFPQAGKKLAFKCKGKKRELAYKTHLSNMDESRP